MLVKQCDHSRIVSFLGKLKSGNPMLPPTHTVPQSENHTQSRVASSHYVVVLGIYFCFGCHKLLSHLQRVPHCSVMKRCSPSLPAHTTVMRHQVNCSHHGSGVFIRSSFQEKLGHFKQVLRRSTVKNSFLILPAHPWPQIQYIPMRLQFSPCSWHLHTHQLPKAAGPPLGSCRSQPSEEGCPPPVPPPHTISTNDPVNWS